MQPASSSKAREDERFSQRGRRVLGEKGVGRFATDKLARHLYLVSSEGVEFQGTVDDGMYDKNTLDFFGYSSREQFQAESRESDKYPVYEPMDSDENVCPACHAATGELHELGCPVELCPWCGGQLVQCSCRYEKLEVESLSSEKELVRFEEILNEQGRISYSPEQRPSFADEGPGVIIE